MKNNNDFSKKWHSYFAVLNNPKQNGYDYENPAEILQALITSWTKDNPHRSVAASFCFGATGTPHIHAIFESEYGYSFSEMKELAPSWHLQPTKGADALDYIFKRGRFAESDEIIVCTSSFGVIKGRNAGNPLAFIQDMLNAGRYKEFLDIGFSFGTRKRYLEKLAEQEKEELSKMES